MSSQLGPSRPFPGLRPYATCDHEWFFGRTAPSLALFRLLCRGRFVAVVGGSGGGKSSLVRAGLLPLLAEETAADGGRRWHCWEFSPGDAPIANLVGALNSDIGRDARDTERAVHEARRERLLFLLNKSSFGLVDALREVAVEPGVIPVVIVDQFEELFRFADLPGTTAARARLREEAAAFVQLLLEATRSNDFPVRIVLTIRCDDLGDCARFHGLPELVSRGEFLLPSLTRDQLEQVIRGPVEKAGSSIEDDVVERLINNDGGDGSDERDRLAALQHALMRTWNHAQSRGSQRLDLSDYQAIGGMAEAVARHAEEIMAEPELKDLGLAVEQVFRALTQVDRQERGIVRRLAYFQLVAESAIPEQGVRRVVDRFRRIDCCFLVPPLIDEQPLDVDDVVELGHEALIRLWPRLSREESRQRRGWVFEEAKDGRIYAAVLFIAREHMSGTSADWPVNQVNARATWWSSRPRTSAWADRYGGDFNSVEKLFADSAARRLQAEQEAAHATRRWRVKVGSALIGGVVLPLSTWVYWQFQATKEELYAAQQSAASAVQALATLQLEIKRAEPNASATPENRASTVQPSELAQPRVIAAEEQPAIAEADEVNADPATVFAAAQRAVAASLAERTSHPDRALLLSVSALRLKETPQARDALLRALQSAQHPPNFLLKHESSVYSLAFSPNGKVLATGDDDKRVTLWDTDRHKAKGNPLTGHKARVSSAVFSPDGSLLVTAGADELIFWDVPSHKKLGVVTAGYDQVIAPRRQGQPPGVTSMAFSPDGKVLAASLSTSVLLFDALRRTQLGMRFSTHRGGVLSVAISANGKTVATGDTNGQVGLWDLASGKPLNNWPTRHSSGGGGVVVAFSPDGKMLASGGRDKNVILWNVATGKPKSEPFKGHQESVSSLAFSPDGKVLASASLDQRVILWDVASRKQRTEPLVGQTKAGVSVAFSADGRFLASGGNDHRALLWTVSAEDWVAMACDVAQRNLTRREWEKAIGENVPYQPACPQLPIPVD